MRVQRTLDSQYVKSKQEQERVGLHINSNSQFDDATRATVVPPEQVDPESVNPRESVRT